MTVLSGIASQESGTVPFHSGCFSSKSPYRSGWPHGFCGQAGRNLPERLRKRACAWNGASDVHTHMVGIKVCPYPVHRTYIARISCMNIRHLHNSYPLESGMVALFPYPLQGGFFDVFGKYFCRGVLSCNYHIIIINCSCVLTILLCIFQQTPV